MMIESLEALVGAKLAIMHKTKQSLADAMGVSLNTLNRKISGESEMSTTEALALSRFLDVTVEDVCSLIEGA